jgi:hypothetical protein
VGAPAAVSGRAAVLHLAAWPKPLCCAVPPGDPQGTATYAPERDALIWKIKNFPGGREFVLRCKFGLPSGKARPGTWNTGGMRAGRGHGLLPSRRPKWQPLLPRCPPPTLPLFLGPTAVEAEDEPQGRMPPIRVKFEVRPTRACLGRGGGNHFGPHADAGCCRTGATGGARPVQVPYFTVSGIQVRYLKVIERSGYQALPWVRYITTAGAQDSAPAPAPPGLLPTLPQLACARSPVGGRPDLQATMRCGWCRSSRVRGWT